MTSTTSKPRGRRQKPKPHQRFAEPLPKLVQPPAALAHLKGQALYRALISDTEMWTAERVALESGRSKRTVDGWAGNYTKAVDGEHPWDDNTFIKPTYVGDTPTWQAGAVRAWLMRTGKMHRNGVFIPYKPTGRPKGIVEAVPRPRRGSEMDGEAPKVLNRYDVLLAHGPAGGRPLTPSAARALLAVEFGLSERQVIRRLQRGRELAAAAAPEQG